MVDAEYFAFSAMGCPCEVRVDGDAEQLLAAARLVVGEVQRLENKYSKLIPDSLWNRMLAAAHERSGVEVDAETAALLELAEQGWLLTGGSFDVTTGALAVVWDRRRDVLPESAAIQHALRHVGWDRVGWSSPTLALLDRGMSIDLDGLVKEHAADSAAQRLREAGIQHALVNLGGDMAVAGPRRNRQPWKIGIPTLDQRDEVLATVKLSEGGVATSGDFERGMEIGGQRLSHILDPRTGWPVTGLSSCSVTAPQCVSAGIMATTAMIKGPIQGRDWLQQAGAPYLMVFPNGELAGTLVDDNRGKKNSDVA